jgi:hypothetical protein
VHILRVGWRKFQEGELRSSLLDMPRINFPHFYGSLENDFITLFHSFRTNYARCPPLAKVSHFSLHVVMLQQLTILKIRIFSTIYKSMQCDIHLFTRRYVILFTAPISSGTSIEKRGLFRLWAYCNSLTCVRVDLCPRLSTSFATSLPTLAASLTLSPVASMSIYLNTLEICAASSGFVLDFKSITGAKVRQLVIPCGIEYVAPRACPML